MHAYALVFGEGVDNVMEPHLVYSEKAFALIPRQELSHQHDPRLTLDTLINRVKSNPILIMDHNQFYDHDGGVNSEIITVGCELEDLEILIVTNGEYQRLVKYANTGFYDWYVVGGRWRGMLVAKKGLEVEALPSIYEQTPDRGVVKRNEVEHLVGDEYDSLRKYEIDFDEMIRRFRETEYYKFNKGLIEHVGDLYWEPVYDDNHFTDWKSFRSSELMLKATEFEKVWVKDKRCSGVGFIDGEILMVEPSKRMAVLESIYICPQLIVNDDGYERRRMGWYWDEVDVTRLGRYEWSQRVLKLIDELPDDTLITVVDIHY